MWVNGLFSKKLRSKEEVANNSKRVRLCSQNSEVRNVKTEKGVINISIGKRSNAKNIFFKRKWQTFPQCLFKLKVKLRFISERLHCPVGSFRYQWNWKQSLLTPSGCPKHAKLKLVWLLKPLLLIKYCPNATH